MNGNKRIGIFTLHRALNFGAVWQCWALKKACEAMGHYVETIDYNPYGHYTVNGALRHNPLVAYTYLTRMCQFNSFVKKRLNPTQHTESHEWIKENPPIDDVYIVGSDTVWANAVVGSYLNYYLLDYAPSSVKRISYAASTGANQLVLTEENQNELMKFSAISVRERQSVDDVQKNVHVPVADVCDPTLLLTKDVYESVEKRPMFLPKRYIVYFDLAGDPFCAKTVRKISEMLKVPILNLAGKYKSWARNFLTPTPEQWLYIIHHADFICTNSFHGVALSLIYRRPFLCCAAQVGGRAKTNGRVQNLLEQTHLQDQLISSITELNQQKLELDYTNVEKYIKEYRERSFLWLKSAIDYESNEK